MVTRPAAIRRSPRDQLQKSSWALTVSEPQMAASCLLIRDRQVVFAVGLRSREAGLETGLLR